MKKKINKNNKKISKIILSAECFSHFEKIEIQRLKKWLEPYSKSFTILIWFRDPISLISSSRQLLFKTGSKTNKVMKHYISYRKPLENWTNVFGKENIKAFNLNETKYNELYNTFFNVCGIQKSLQKKLLKEAKNLNPSISMEASLLLSSLNKQRPYSTPLEFQIKNPKDRNIFYENYIFSKIKGNKFRPSKKILYNLCTELNEEINWLVDNFGDEFKDYRKWEEKLKNLDEPKLFQQETIASIALIISDLINQNPKLKNYNKNNIVNFFAKTIGRIPILGNFSRYIWEKISNPSPQ